MKEAIKKIYEKINKIHENQDIINTSKIKKINSIKSNNKIVFIDGGQTEIIKKPDLSLQFIRIVGVVFKDNKKIKSYKKEFFLIIYTENKNDKIMYKTETIPISGETNNCEIEIDSFDNSIREGNERASISNIGNIFRRFSEIDIGVEICKELDFNDIIILDGTLKCCVKGEKEHMKNLYEIANKNKVIISSIQKTSNTLVKNAKSIISMINNIDKKISFYYDPDIECDGYHSYIIKLNPKAKYSFEFNIYNNENIENTLGIISSNSNDSVFLGYPYGLILADRLARVTNNEKEHLIIKIKSKFNSDWKNIESGIRALDSHNILDNVY